ncbi:MAG: polysaccharide biosynthesis tyrosine autokinase [Phycisphaeraceae bacterium]|nr:polysaccharide biosynthesis tyrosine autokinase [Phycisphaeraceae bacterium]
MDNQGPLQPLPAGKPGPAERTPLGHTAPASGPVPMGPVDAGHKPLLGVDLISLLLRRGWLILLGGLIGFGVAVMQIRNAVPLYESESVVYIERRVPRVISENSIYEHAGGSGYLYTQSALMVSTPILADALRSLEDQDIDMLKGSNPVMALKQAVSVSVGGRNEMITVSAKMPDPKHAAQTVNALVDAYVRFYGEQNQSTAADVRSILQREKVKRDQELARKFKAMMDFRSQNEQIALEGDKGSMTLTRIQRLNEAMTTAELAAIEAEADYRAIQRIVRDPKIAEDPAKLELYLMARDAGAGEEVRNSRWSHLNEEINKLEAELIALKQNVTDRHPSVERVQKKIARHRGQLDEALRQLLKAQVIVAEERYRFAQQRLADLTGAFEAQRKKMLKLASQRNRHALLESEWKQTQKLVDILDEKIKTISVGESIGGPDINVLEVARPAAVPIWPDKNKIAIQWVLLGLVGGFGIGWLMERMDQRLRSSEEVSALLSAPVIGMVPDMGRRLEPVAAGQVVDRDSSSATAEGFRTIRTAIYFGLPKEHSKAIQITSPVPGEGKSTTTSNLAIAMAQAGGRTLIIDADFRRPMQHQIFQVPNDQGLSAVVAGRLDADKAVVKTPMDNLWLLPTGIEPPNPAEVLNSRSFTDLLEQLRDRYDNILIDSPPLLPVADSRIIAARVDVTALVVRIGVSSRKTTESAIGALETVGGRLLGVIVNAMPAGRRYGRYGYYGSYGTYGSRNGNGNGKRAAAAADNDRVAADDAGVARSLPAASGDDKKA